MLGLVLSVCGAVVAAVGRAHRPAGPGGDRPPDRVRGAGDDARRQRRDAGRAAQRRLHAPVRRGQLLPRDAGVLQGARRCGRPTTARCCSGTSSWPATSPRWRCGSAATARPPSRTRWACCSACRPSTWCWSTARRGRSARWPRPPPTGAGPAPLLQNHPLMAVHPPFLYLGFIGFTVPFAFGVAALLAGSGSDAVGLDHPALDAAGLVLPHHRAGARRAVVLLGARLGRVLGLGPGGERRAAALAGVHRVPALGHAAGTPRDGQAVEHRAGHRGVRAHDLRDVPDPGQRAVLGARVRAVRGRARRTWPSSALVLLGGFGLVAWRLPTLRTPARLDVDGVPGGGDRRQQHAAAGRDRDHPAGHGVPADRRGRDRRADHRRRPVLPERARAGVPAACCCWPAPRRCCPGGRSTGSGRSAGCGCPVLAAALVVVGTAAAGLRDLYAVAGFGAATLVLVSNGQEIASGLARRAPARRRAAHAGPRPPPVRRA